MLSSTERSPIRVQAELLSTECRGAIEKTDNALVKIQCLTKRLDEENDHFNAEWSAEFPLLSLLTTRITEYQQTVDDLTRLETNVSMIASSVLEQMRQKELEKQKIAPDLIYKFRCHLPTTLPEETYSALKTSIELGNLAVDTLITLHSQLQQKSVELLGRINHFKSHPLQRLVQLIEHRKAGTTPNYAWDKAVRWLPSFYGFTAPLFTPAAATMPALTAPPSANEEKTHETLAQTPSQPTKKQSRK